MPITKSFAGLSVLGFGVLPGGAFESIATVTVGSGGASSIEFTSIPGTYQHLQIRMISSTTSGGYGTPFLRLNSDSGSNYSRHQIYGINTTVGAGGNSNQTEIQLAWVQNASYPSSFGASVTDILDYASTSKYTTIRCVGGVEVNATGAGIQGILSGLWLSAAAITTVTITPPSGSFRQYSTAALYGIKAP